MTAYLFVLLLAVVQGVAEFLPISSSGHLAVLGTLCGFDPEANMALGIVLHAGTLAAILIFYLRELLKFFKPERFHLMLMLMLGSIPAGAVGVLLKSGGWAEAVFNNLLVAGCGFLATGAMLQYSESRRKKETVFDDGVAIEKISWKQALLIGAAQAVAILPGVSRSGSTISAGLFAGLRRTNCAEFSFLLAIPAIGGAALLELLDLIKAEQAEIGGIPGGALVLGFAVSAVVGYISLQLLVKMLNRGKLSLFSGYLYVIGAAVILWQLVTLFK
jgi:undecaprenyl-diphosphatase